MNVIMSACALALTGAAFAPQAQAQSTEPQTPPAAPEATADNDGMALQDIIVTARRREESVISVPLSVTALSADQLQSSSVTTLSQVDRIAAGIRIAPVAGRVGVLSVSIRGMVDTGGLFTTDPTVAIYFADAIQLRAQGAGRSFYDIASVQVLKGPQGTLFGRNLTGGAILIQPVAPVLGRTEGYGQALYGNYDRAEFQGALNVPIGDKIALRIAGNVARRDGFVTNLVTGTKLRQEDSDSFRASLLIEPTDNVSNLLIVDHYKSRGFGGAIVPTEVNPAVNTPVNPLAVRQAALARQRARSIYQVEETADSPNRARNTGVTNTTTFDLGGATLKNIFNFRRVSSYDRGEDGIAQDLLFLISSGEARQVTDELQLSGNLFGGALEYQVGAYYLRETGTLFQNSTSFGVPRFTNSKATNSSQSVFAQFDYHLTDKLTATAGARYTWDKREIEQAVTGPTTPTFNAAREVRFSKPSWTFSLAYKPDADSLIYAATRRGYRSGGFNGGATNAVSLTVVEPETLTDAEIGAKSQGSIGDVRYRVSLAAYYSDYRNMQRSLVQSIGTPPAPTRVLLNAGKARIQGVEFEGTLIPFRFLELSGSVAYTDAKYTDYRDPLTGADITSLPFALTPRWTYRVGAKVNLPSFEPEGDLSLAVDYYKTTKFLNTDVTAILPGYVSPGYGLLGARLSYDNIAGSNIRLAVFGTNLTNEQYFVSGTPFYGAPFGLSGSVSGEPRQYGVEVGFKF
ncbi:TonB-dependent receptor [Sphingomonas sp. MG17]|uniref:TonB-dependent receptor n=1 Tax=Sphingomonas tagetis TaxID=2949092 RepID=A0A9X2HKH0_9SPHN|nr:TonB-dependent receptor [Sphingomonas tagetis]MCP3730311.1 TonB-dependent receptor [Sphingomonas tagetis]